MIEYAAEIILSLALGGVSWIGRRYILDLRQRLSERDNALTREISQIIQGESEQMRHQLAQMATWGTATSEQIAEALEALQGSFLAQVSPMLQEKVDERFSSFEDQAIQCIQKTTIERLELQAQEMGEGLYDRVIATIQADVQKGAAQTISGKIHREIRAGIYQGASDAVSATLDDSVRKVINVEVGKAVKKGVEERVGALMNEIRQSVERDLKKGFSLPTLPPDAGIGITMNSGGLVDTF